MTCRHCGDNLPTNCPPDVITCRGYCDWIAYRLGDRLPASSMKYLILLAALCSLDAGARAEPVSRETPS